MNIKQFEVIREKFSERLFDDGNTGNIGIGTSSPSAKLHIGDGSSCDNKINFTIESMTSNEIRSLLYDFSEIDNLEPKTINQLEKEHIDWVKEDPYYHNEELYV